MKKYRVLIVVLVLILMTSCLTKIDLNKAGSFNITIKWPKNSQASLSNNTNGRILTNNVETVIVSMYQLTKPENVFSKSVNHTNEPYHIIEFKGLLEGKWHFSVTCKDNTGTDLSKYEDEIDIVNGASTIVQTNFGLPKIIENVYNNPNIIQNSALNVISGNLGVISPESTYSSDIELGKTNITFEVSTSDKFETILYSILYPGNLTSQKVSSGELCQIGSFGVIGSSYPIEYGKKYYWRVKAENTVGYIYSKTFSFTTKSKIHSQ